MGNGFSEWSFNRLILDLMSSKGSDNSFKESKTGKYEIYQEDRHIDLIAINHYKRNSRN